MECSEWVDGNREIRQIKITKPRYGSIHPWPLNLVLPWRKQSEVKSRLKSIGWKDKSIEEICDEVRTCCQALSERLDKQNYFFGDRPTELDALVFGHLFTLLTTGLPIDYLTDIIKEFQNLIEFCQRVEDKYYKENDE